MTDPSCGRLPSSPTHSPTRRVALGVGGGVVAAGMAVLWWFVVPDKADTAGGLHAAAIRYGHPATWSLLALLGVLVATDAPARVRTVVGALSAACYAAFLAGLVL